MTKNINTLLRNMKKSRYSNKPMVEVKEKPKQKKMVMKVKNVNENNVIVVKETNKIENKIELSKNMKNKMRLMSRQYLIDYIPNAVNMINTVGYAFGITSGVKVMMSNLGVSMENIRKIMENEVAKLHDINGTVLYTNGYLTIYVNNKKNVTNIVFTKKMKRLINQKKQVNNEGVNGLFVNMVIEFGELIEDPYAIKLLNLRAGFIYVMCNSERIQTSKGDLFLSSHAMSRMILRDIKLNDIKKSIEYGNVVTHGVNKVYVGEFCTVVTEYGVVKTVYTTLNLAEEFGIKKITHDQYKVISSTYRIEGKPVTEDDMIEKIRVGLGLVSK